MPSVPGPNRNARLESDLTRSPSDRRMSAIGATVAFRLRPQSGAHRLFIGATAKGRSGSICPVRQALGERPLFACAVRRRRFPVGESPTRRTLQPEATGAVMEVTKWLKPSV